METHYFAPAALFRMAATSCWPAIALAGITAMGSSLVALRSRSGRPNIWQGCRDEGVVIAWPIYLWGVLASVNCVLASDLVTTRADPEQIWATGLSQFLGLGMVLVASGAGAIWSVTASGSWRQVSVGPLIAIGAVATDWLVFLLVVTPLR